MEIRKMQLRSSAPLPAPPKLKKALVDPSTLPYLMYKGKVEYYTTSLDCALSCDKLLQMVNKSTDNVVLGFDMEWPFSFQTGAGKSALIQISPDLDVCYLYHISEFKRIPVVLTELLSHEKVKLTGVNIKNDIHKLTRDFPGINAEKILSNCIDLRTIAKTVVDYLPSWSLKSLVNHFFEKEISKDKRVRNSKWNVIPLSKVQMDYAALDAYVSLKLYFHLKNLQIEKGVVN